MRNKIRLTETNVLHSLISYGSDDTERLSVAFPSLYHCHDYFDNKADRVSFRINLGNMGKYQKCKGQLNYRKWLTVNILMH